MKVELNKSFKERVLQAILFEIFANVFIVFFIQFLLSKSIEKSAVLSIGSAMLAMLWNMIYNKLFDLLQQKIGFERGLIIRVIHAVIFELGLMIVLVPAAVLWLQITIYQALLLDISVILFFLPYTIIFNWAYDGIRYKITSNK
jgi:uncharacterized membrane protein